MQYGSGSSIQVFSSGSQLTKDDHVAADNTLPNETLLTPTPTKIK